MSNEKRAPGDRVYAGDGIRDPKKKTSLIEGLFRHHYGLISREGGLFGGVASLAGA